MQPAFARRVASSRSLLRQQPSLRTNRPSSSSSSSYICNDCLRKSSRRIGARYLHQGVTSFPPPSSIDPRIPTTTTTYSSSSNDLKHDDTLLRSIFDSPEAYKSFTSRSQKPHTGLFQNRFLTTPNGFIIFANSCLKKAKRVVDRVSRATSQEDHIRIIKDLDRLSDLLCRVLDLADFIRNTHPDEKFVMAADKAFQSVYEYMNILNTTTDLYTSLKAAMYNPAVVSHWDETSRAVGRTLLLDFEKSGINLPDKSKRRFVSLSNDISRLGRDFVSNAAAANPYITFKREELAGMQPWTINSLSRITNSGIVYLPVRGSVAHHALQTVKDEEVRYKIWKEQQTAPKQQIALLENLLKKRAELARLVRRESHSAVTLADKMARSPEAVTTFLHSMLSHTRPLADKEISNIISQKSKSTGTPTSRIYAYEKDYYLHQVVEHQRTRLGGDPDISSYFSLGTVMQGLSRLFTNLYGIRLLPRETSPGEIWNPDVRRLDVISDTEGHIAVVYCDLFQRDGKNPNPAHFTVRCSRAIDEEEIIEERLEEGGGDGMATARNKEGVLYQLPTIALICDFSTPPGSSTPLLSFHEVTTLFHEMGHAIHSIIGRTKFHEVAGTRCPTDFAEFPSILMEHFARSPQVLSLFARHYKTDAALPTELLNRRLAVSKTMENCETYQQVLLALLDQELHSAKALETGFDSTAVYRGLEKKYGLFPAGRPGSLQSQEGGEEEEAGSWQGYFTHLFGYGGLYYSYMLDKAIADKVWKEVFVHNPVSRDAGERYKDEVLRWGGSRDPWKCIGRLLKREDLVEDAEGRMEEVGRWGAEAA
ncbi:Mitochondrial intermediate peptidase [Orbilia blumenaviensis]|uniref:Mitochondrial intermediate peptidase n=1 Tax=Orbilia blumenaviensis TaxID=1796055 RepID=A0AAV9VJ48_9PEZI